MGKKYPDSTGGEIFNYYGTDSNANTASGNYSTTIGYNNKNTGEQSFVGGNNNTNASNRSLVYGYNNTLTIAGEATENIILGGSNSNTPRGTTPQKATIIIGNDNVMNQSGRGNKMFGSGLKDDTTSYQRIYLGTFNAPATTAPHYFNYGGFTLGAGKNDTTRYNAMEIFTGAFAGGNNEVHIPSPFFFSLNTLGNKANEIVAPLSNPASTDDQTLATKAYVDGHTIGITVPRAEVLLTGQSTTVSNGGSISLETDLSLTLPTWTKQLRLGIHNSGGYVEYLLIDNVSAHSYVSVTGAGTVDVYSYDPATTTFTFVSGGTSMSIVSVRVEGTASI